MAWPIIDWRHDNTGRLFYDSTRRFQEGVLTIVNQAGYPDIRIAHLAVTRHIDLAGTRIADIAQRAGVTKQSMSQMIETLEAMGFVARQPDPHDKRAKTVVFTPAGLALLGVIREAVETCEQDLRARIGDRAWRQLRLILIGYCRTDTVASRGGRGAARRSDLRTMLRSTGATASAVAREASSFFRHTVRVLFSMSAGRAGEGRQVQQVFDRAAEDLGNALHLEHVNVNIPDQRLASLFYVAGLGLTRDPYLMVSDDNMWVNVGRSQFHLPTGQAQRLRGHTGIVIAGREALLARLAAVREALDGTRFGFADHNEFVEAVCPWGNRIRCWEPDAARFGRITLGIPYVEFDVPPGTARGIADFYRYMIEAPADVVEDGTVARVAVGLDQHLIFRETDRPQGDFDNHHVQIYVANFSGPHRRLAARNLVSREDNRYQYRFRDIIDPDSGRHLFTIEHEVRSMTHPNFMRPLANRNPAQTARTYSPGHDQWIWAMPPAPREEHP